MKLAELEVLQWVVIVVIAIMVLGLYRQLAVYLGAPTAGSVDALTGPRIRRKVPPAVLRALRELPGVDPTRPYLMLFVSEDCRSCQRLLASLASTEIGYRVRHDAMTNVVLVPESNGGPFLSALAELDVPILRSDDVGWSTVLDVGVTPFALMVTENGLVAAKGVHHDIAVIAGEFLESKGLVT